MSCLLFSFVLSHTHNLSISPEHEYEHMSMHPNSTQHACWLSNVMFHFFSFLFLSQTLLGMNTILLLSFGWQRSTLFTSQNEQIS
jgi:hypothetical protein